MEDYIDKIVYNEDAVEETINELTQHRKVFNEIDNEAYNTIMKIQNINGFDLVFNEIDMAL